MTVLVLVLVAAQQTTMKSFHLRLVAVVADVPLPAGRGAAGGRAPCGRATRPPLTSPP